MNDTQLDILKDELLKQTRTEDAEFVDLNGQTVIIRNGHMFLDPIPYFEKDQLRLLFCGLEITLNRDGTWFWEDTTGG